MKSPEELFDLYVDGSLSPEELARVEEWIAEDPANAKQFLLWSATNLDTRVALQSDSLRAAATVNLNPSEPTALADGRDPMSEASSQARRLRGSALLRYGTVAIAASLLATISLLTWQSRQQPTTVDTADPFTSKDNIAARVIQRIDCVMQDERWSLANPNEFEAGQSVRLSEGLAILQFSRGAQVTLQGPAELEIVSDNSGFLHSGRLTATVPPKAIGFEILTPNSRVIDHGTEFGVSVDENGDTETHVFDGEVELIATQTQLPQDAGQPNANAEKGRQLKEKMAARIRSETGVRTESIAASPEKFIRLPVRDIDSAERLASITDLPARDNLVMWFEADQGVQLDSDSRVISWQNLATATQRAVGDEIMPNSTAWQVDAESRPLWKAESFAGHAAIRFGGYDSREFLATTPIQTGNDVTVLVVCSFGSVEGVGYGHIVSLGNRTRLIVERKFADAVGTYSWSWRKDRTPHFRKEVLEANDRVPPATPLLCAVRYSQKSNTYDLFCNGQLQSSGEAIGSLATDASHVIGCDGKRDRFFFNGSIAEIVVYDHMLDRQSFDKATTTLMGKYGIQSESKN